MRAATIAAAALPLGAYAAPLGVSVQIPNPVCLPYSIIISTLQNDPLLVPFCSKYVNIPVTTQAKLGAAAITVTAPITVNGGGAVTTTSLTTVTVAAAAPNAVTNYVTVSVTVPTATTVATCLNSAYSAPVKKLSRRQLPNPLGGFLGGIAPRPATGGTAPLAGTGPAPAPGGTAPLPGGTAPLLGGTSPAPAPGGVAPTPGGVAPAPGGAPAPAPIAAPAPAPVAPAGPAVTRPAYIPSTYSDAVLQIICGCVSIPAQVTTVQAAMTTVTLLPKVTINAPTTVPVTSTVTVTGAARNAQTVTSTTTTTIGAVATNINPNGLVYKKFPSSFSGYNSNAGFNSGAFKGLIPDFTGVWSNLNFATPYWPSMSVADTIQLDQSAPFDVSQAALLFQGFFVAPQTGTYTFSVPAASNDNFAELWTGSAALTWADSAAAFKAIRTAQSSTDGMWTVSLNAGDAMPFSYLWANGGGAGQSAFNIAFPDGSSPSDFSKLFVQPCSGNVFSS